MTQEMHKVRRQTIQSPFTVHGISLHAMHPDNQAMAGRRAFHPGDAYANKPGITNFRLNQLTEQAMHISLQTALALG